MTKEEYKENLVRMYDSLRTEYKGKRNCDGIECNNCPFNGKVCYAGEILYHAYDAIEIVETVENWVKEHPIKTNADKFREVFGFKPFTNNCINGEVKCDKCEYFDYNDGLCDVGIFWGAEYMPPTKEGE